MTRDKHEPVDIFRAPPRRRRNLLTWLSGADPDTLAHAGRDYGKFVGLGGVVLTTATMAAVAATFAMRIAARAPLPLAIAFGLLWGMAIMNLDRWLVTATQRRERWYLNLGVVLPRLVVALIIGAVVSTPLVLQIFQREIDAELDLIHQKRADQHQQDLVNDTRFKGLADLEASVAKLQRVADGTEPPPGVDTDPRVAPLLAEYNTLDSQYQTAQKQVTCEFDGTCGTGQVGGGPAYQQKLRVANELKVRRDQAKTRLDAARALVSRERQASSGNARQSAMADLAVQKEQLDRLRRQKKAEEEQFLAHSLNDRGLLARLEALSRFTAQNSTLRTAYVLLLLFITSIEVMPVLVKFLMSIGPASSYDRILVQAEKADVDRASAALDYEKNVAVREFKTRATHEEAAVTGMVERMVAAEMSVYDKMINNWQDEQLRQAATDPAGFANGRQRRRWFTFRPRTRARDVQQQLGRTPYPPPERRSRSQGYEDESATFRFE